MTTTIIILAAFGAYTAFVAIVSCGIGIVWASKQIKRGNLKVDA